MSTLSRRRTDEIPGFLVSGTPAQQELRATMLSIGPARSNRNQRQPA
jgi:hypothetical protein